MSIESMAFEYYRQTARTNNAAPVADLAQKPVSDFTVELVSGQAQYIATLTQPAPVRIWWHFQTLVDWLQVQSIGSVWDAVEAQVISGNGTAPIRRGFWRRRGRRHRFYATRSPDDAARCARRPCRISVSSQRRGA